MSKASKGRSSSITTGNKGNKVAASATMFLIEKNAFKVLLLEIYEDLLEKGMRGKWFAFSMTVLGSGLTGLIEWFIEDVMTADLLSEVEWICTKSLIYGSFIAVACISLIIYISTATVHNRNSKKAFVEHYMKYEELDTLSQPYQVSSATLRNPAASNTVMNNTDIQAEEELGA